MLVAITSSASLFYYKNMPSVSVRQTDTVTARLKIQAM